MDPIISTFAILGIAIVAFLIERIPVAITAIVVALLLWATGVLTLNEAFAGFGDPTVLFIASLFVVSEGLDASGVTAWVGAQVGKAAGNSKRRVLALVMGMSVVLTALISVNGAVAALLPMSVLVAMRNSMAPSKLLLPLAFAAHAGSLLAMTGSPVNVLLSDFAFDASGRAFGFFEFALVGIPLVAGTFLITMLFGGVLIPNREPVVMPRDLSAHRSALGAQYPSALSNGKQIDQLHGVAEVMLPPRSDLVDLEVFPGMATPSGDLIILSILRNGRELSSHPIRLEVGDTLLLGGPWELLDQQIENSPEVLVVDTPDALRRQLAPLNIRSFLAIGILASMVLLLSLNLVPPAVAGLLAAGAMILTGVVPLALAYRNISWTTVILVAGMIPLSTAFLNTGAAEVVSGALLRVLNGASPTMVVLVICLATAAFGQIISNTATALIMAPVALSVAADLGLSPLPFLMALTVTAAASFLTPVATPVNLMIKGPAGYKLSDYPRLGLPLLLLFLTVATLLVPVLWPFMP